MFRSFSEHRTLRSYLGPAKTGFRMRIRVGPYQCPNGFRIRTRSGVMAMRYIRRLIPNGPVASTVCARFMHSVGVLRLATAKLLSATPERRTITITSFGKHTSNNKPYRRYTWPRPMRTGRRRNARANPIIQTVLSRLRNVTIPVKTRFQRLRRR